MIKILNILPVVPSEGFKESIAYRGKLGEQISAEFHRMVTIDTIPLESGLPSIESSFDEAINIPEILKKAKWAEENNYNAVTIDCFADPGLDALKELLNIPVVGPFQASVHLAVQLGQKFSIINTVPSLEHVFISLSKKYGVSDNLASIRTLNIPVLDLTTFKENTLLKIVREIKEAVFKDDADVVILGCTGISVLEDKLRSALNSELLNNIPILDPLKVALYTAINICMLGLVHSKKRYNLPSRSLELIYKKL